MQTKSTDRQSTGSTGDTTGGFYNVFVSILFGFVASAALQWLAEGLTQRTVTWSQAALICGVLVLVIHFWLICVSTDELEDRVYLVADRGKKSRVFNLLFIFTLGMSAVFACALLIMARSCFSGGLLFWQSFLGLAMTSFLYDIIALLLSAPTVLQDSIEPDKGAIRTYVRLFGSWLIQDACFLALSAGVYWCKTCALLPHYGCTIVFLGGSTAALIADVVFLHPGLYRKL